MTPSFERRKHYRRELSPRDLAREARSVGTLVPRVHTEEIAMPDIAHPTLRLRRLGMHLRRLREDAGMTLDEASKRMERSLSSLSKIETGRNLVRVRDLRIILDTYGLADDELRESLLALLRDAGKRGWWQRHGDLLTPASQDFLSLEADAAAARNFETLLIPGLLQTADYARTVIQADPTAPNSIVDELVDVRAARQAILTQPDPMELWAIVSEAALWHQIGGSGIMRDQLRHLMEASELDNITLQVLPYSAGAHAGLNGPFVMLDFPEYANWSIVYIGNLAGSLYLEQEEEIRRFTLVFNHLRASALPETDSRTLINRMAKDL
jgi:transcriptional regulator with XRE-family HTH domain